ncbi:MAG: ABC transporter ATP-binding protein [Odoribacteraceae bacterium]|jgi:ABC-2 type transport system ATP-binding protein|nr:ABC transporter ATP-binding protein [Odoribacteraceae bacterium]
METPIVKIAHLSHRYSVQWAIRDINFEIYQKGVLGLLGSNGAGKSTTMNIMCGVLNQTEGEVYIDGVNFRADPIRAKLNIGFLPQRPPLYADLTVDEYLRYCAELRSVPPREIRERVEMAKQKCGVTRFSRRVIKFLSGGYQQRVGIAQAIIHGPKFVVLDEPTNGLDPNQILEIRQLIKEIAEDRSVLLSTHILSEVEATCDHIKMIEAGHLVFSGTIGEFNNYLQPDSLVATFKQPPGEDELRTIPGISAVEPLSAGAFRLRFNADDDVTCRVVDLSVARGWALSEITVERCSLDTVFAQLSGKRDQQTRTNA